MAEEVIKNLYAAFGKAQYLSDVPKATQAFFENILKKENHMISIIIEYFINKIKATSYDSTSSIIVLFRYSINEETI